MTHIEQTADAITALINSKPRTPTRDEIVSALAKLPPAATPLLRPSELGRELIEKLLPAYIEAVRYSSSSEIDDPDEDEFEAASSAAMDALFDRMHQATNIVDLAIACFIANDGDTPADKLAVAKKQWEAFDRHEGYDEPQSAEEVMDNKDIINYRLVSTILAMAGVDERQCSCREVSETRGWHTTPTATERATALARLRGAHTNNGKLLRALLA